MRNPRTAALAVALVFLLWLTPPGTPLRWAVAALHEGGHALAALATGGAVVDMQIRPDRSETHTAGGWPVVILMLGYPAPSLVAGLLLRAGMRWPGWLLGVAALCDVAEDLGRGDAAALPGPPLLWSAGWAVVALAALRVTPRRQPRSLAAAPQALQ